MRESLPSFGVHALLLYALKHFGFACSDPDHPAHADLAHNVEREWAWALGNAFMAEVYLPARIRSAHRGPRDPWEGRLRPTSRPSAPLGGELQALDVELRLRAVPHAPRVSGTRVNAALVDRLHHGRAKCFPTVRHANRRVRREADLSPDFADYHRERSRCGVRPSRDLT